MHLVKSSGSASPTLLFLHYFGGSSLEWDQTIPLLDHHFHCITADAPGFGAAAASPNLYTVEEMAQSLLAFIATNISGPFLLVGHSMMGKVSMVAASRRPPNLLGLILVAPSPLEPEPMTEDARATMADARSTPETAREFFVKGAHRPLTPAQIAQGTHDALRANPNAFHRWPQSGTREDWSTAIPAIDLPALRIVGDHDTAIPLAFQREHTLPHLPNARLEVILNAAHLLPYEAPEALAQLIEPFAVSLR